MSSPRTSEALLHAGRGLALAQEQHRRLVLLQRRRDVLCLERLAVTRGQLHNLGWRGALHSYRKLLMLEHASPLAILHEVRFVSSSARPF